MRCTPRLASLLLLALACTPAWAQNTREAKSDAPGPAIDLPLPWKVGGVLRYATEQVESRESAQGKQESIATGITEARTRRAGDDGFTVDWVSRDSTHKTVHGDDGIDGLLQAAVQQMEGEPMTVVLNADGSYERVDNIDRLSKRMREVLGPVLDKTLAMQEAKAPAQGDDARRKADSAKARAAMQVLLDNITSPKVLESMATKQIRNIAFFNAGGLEDGQDYELETALENPTGGQPFPSRMTFRLWVSKDDPEDVFIEWQSSIDTAKGAAALADTVERLFGAGNKVRAEDLPATLSVEDKGLLLIHRPSGMVEMYEDERTSVVGDVRKYERNRMRLLDAGHGHDWTSE